MKKFGKCFFYLHTFCTQIQDQVENGSSRKVVEIKEIKQILTSLKRKKAMSPTPVAVAQQALSLTLQDTAAALVLLLLKKLRMGR